jgi:hypothetical protein
MFAIMLQLAISRLSPAGGGATYAVAKLYDSDRIEN